MKLGAEPKKIVILGSLMLVLAYFLYTNLLSSSGGAAEVVEPWFRGRPAFLYQLNAF